MKKLILFSTLFTIGLFTITAYTSCKKDENKCKDIVCSNEGACIDGVCSCPPDFTGDNCEKLTCEVKNTAKVRFSNQSANSTYVVVWDGQEIITIGPGVITNYQVVTTGVHTLKFKYEGSSAVACSQTPNVQQCTVNEYTCTK